MKLLSAYRMRKTLLSCLACLFSVLVHAPVFCQEDDCRASGVLSLQADPDPAAGQEFQIRAGEELQFSLTAMLETHFAGRWGVQGFSLSVAHDNEVLEITGATLDDTDASEVFPFSFERIETVENETGSGFVCALVPSLTNPVTLPPEGVSPLARASYRVRPQTGSDGDEAPAAVRVVSTLIEYRGGLRGAGQPVNNRLTHNGMTVNPCSEPLEVSLVFLQADAFLRGDSNASGTLDISDALQTIGYLFLGMEAPGCLVAADANDDGRINLVDPFFCLDFLFRRGRAPPEPFPAAGRDPTDDGLSCLSPGS